MWSYGWGGAWGGGTLMVVFWLVVVAGIVWLVRAARVSPDPGGDRARRILDERFARGELSADDYQAARRVLG